MSDMKKMIALFETWQDEENSGQASPGGVPSDLIFMSLGDDLVNELIGEIEDSGASDGLLVGSFLQVPGGIVVCPKDEVHVRDYIQSRNQ